MVASTRMRSSVPTMTSSEALLPASIAAAEPGNGLGLEADPWLPFSAACSVAARSCPVSYGAGAGEVLSFPELGSEPRLPALLISSALPPARQASECGPGPGAGAGAASAAVAAAGPEGASTGSAPAANSTGVHGAVAGALCCRASRPCTASLLSV